MLRKLFAFTGMACLLAVFMPVGAAHAQTTNQIVGVITGKTVGGSACLPMGKKLPSGECDPAAGSTGTFDGVKITGAFKAGTSACVTDVSFATSVTFVETAGNLAVGTGYLPGGEDFSGVGLNGNCSVNAGGSQISVRSATPATSGPQNGFSRVGAVAIAFPSIDLSVTLLGTTITASQIPTSAVVTAVPGANPDTPGNPSNTAVAGLAAGAS